MGRHRPTNGFHLFLSGNHAHQDARVLRVGDPTKSRPKMSAPFRIAHVDTERSWRGGENQVLLLMNGLRNLGHFNVAVVRPKSALNYRAQEAHQAIFETQPWGEWDFIAA